MKRVMCLKFRNWPIQRQQKLLPSDQRLSVAIHTPVVSGTAQPRRGKTKEDADLRFVREVFPALRSGPGIVCVSDSAWASGVRPGMPLAEARSMAAPPTRSAYRRHVPRGGASTDNAETCFLEWNPAEDRRALMAIAELTRRFAPIVGLDEMSVPDSLLLDITGCGQLFGGESSLAEQLVKRISQQNLQCHAIISDSVATAWAFAHTRGHALIADQRPRTSGNRNSRVDSSWDLPVVIIPPGQTESWLQSLPVSAARIPYADVQTLSQLGVLTLKQLLGLPMEDLPSRLSEMTVRRLRQIRGAEEELITAIPEADPVAAVWVSEFPATQKNEVRQVMEHLVLEIAEQLHRRAVGAVRVACQLKQENGDVISLIGDVVKPVQSGTELFEVLNLRLESLRLAPILSVRMTATIAPLPVARQKDLFSASAHIEPAEELAAMVNRLTSRLGKSSVLTARANDDPTPGKAVQLQPVMGGGDEPSSAASAEQRLQELVTPEHSGSGKALPRSRPLCLFSSPVGIAGAESGLPSGEFRWNGQAYRVSAATEPERIQTQWWHETAVHRDYYRVQTECGSEFWIYCDLNSGSWFLHGVFE